MEIKKFNSFINENMNTETSIDVRGNIVRIGDTVTAIKDVNYMMRSFAPGQIDDDKVRRGEEVEIESFDKNGDYYLTTHADIYGPYDKYSFLLTGEEPLSEDEMIDFGIDDQEDYMNGNSVLEGYNLNTLKSRVDYMKDLYVKVVGRGDEIFKVVSVEVNDIHDGSLVIVSEETGGQETINHDDIASSIVGDEYEGHVKKSREYNKDSARSSANTTMGNYGNPIKRFKR